MIKAVIFDLDGTLLDTIQDIANTCNKLLEKRSYPTLPLKDYKIYVGKGVKHLIMKVMEALNIPKYLLDDLLSDYYQIYKDESSKTTKVYEGINDLLKELIIQDIKVCVLSNKPHEQVSDLMPKYFKEDMFSIVYGKHHGIDAKPNPALLRKMIKTLRLKKTEILYVGDTKTDMETALNAGVQSVGVLWGFRDEMELVQARASYIVKEPREILEVIREKNKDSRKKQD